LNSADNLLLHWIQAKKRPSPVSIALAVKMLMKRKLNCILNVAVLGMLLIISSTISAEKQPNETYSGLGFNLLKPKNITVTCENPVEDFQIYRFQKGESLILSIYSGNAPSFPTEKFDTKPKITKINGYKTESYEKKDSNNFITRNF
jgi:hypothetical protein